jgi:tyrosine-protein kinase Etk/Wzc
MNRRLLFSQFRDFFIAGAVGFVLGTVYGLVTPKWYEAQLSVVPASQQKGSSGLASLAGSLPVDLPFDVSGGGSGPDVERIQAVLKSRSVTDALIEKFGLSDRYHSATMEAARKDLWHHCATKLDKKPAVVTVTCEDRDPRLARDITEYFGQIGNITLTRISESSAGEERRFLEKRLVDAKHDVEETSTRMKEFELKHRLVDIGEQSKAVVTAMATLKGELLSKQIQLSYLNSFSSEDESTAKQLRRQVSIMEDKLKSLEVDPSAPENSGSDEPAPGDKKRPAKKSEPGLFPPAMAVPDLRFQLATLYRNQKIQETLFLMLTQRYETAKVNEARDTSAFQILDHAVLPTRKSRPSASLSALIGCALALAAAFGRRRLGDYFRSRPA